MPSNYQDIEDLLKETGVVPEEAHAFMTDLGRILPGTQSSPEEFRLELKDKLLARARQKPGAKLMTWFSPKRNKYAGIAAAVLILAAGASYYMNPGIERPDSGLNQENGGTMKIMAVPDAQQEAETSKDSSLTNSLEAHTIEDQTLPERKNPDHDQPVDNQSPASLGETGSAVNNAGKEVPVERDEAIHMAKSKVDYPAKVLDVILKQIDGQDYWQVSLTRDGVGIPNRDDFIINVQTGEVTNILSAQ
ncbi:MAG: PepSY domain-containing protein [Bacillota bacterium]